MPALLHLDSSAGPTDESVTRKLSALFAETYCAAHASSSYCYRDLAAEPITHIGEGLCTLGRRIERGELVPPCRVAEHIESAAECSEWAQTLPLIEELLAADTIVIGAPMYNYSIPASLKAWIDRVSFPGAFLDPETRKSRLARTRIVVISARGGAYGPGSPREAMDFETPYLRAYFERHGVPAASIAFVNAEMTLSSIVPRLASLRPHAAASLAAAQSEIIELAAT